MDKPIQKGDLVMVVRGMPCCGAVGVLGSVWTATGTKVKGGRCAVCFRDVFEDEINVEGDRHFFISRLKRIPPLTEDIETEEEAHA